MRACLELEDGSMFFGTSFGARRSVCGEVVFNTGMVGYPESLTDPSYRGQVLVMTYPLMGNYGVPRFGITSDGVGDLESSRIQISALVVAEHCSGETHGTTRSSLESWMLENGVPGLSGIDTRALTQRLRTAGTMLGKITIDAEEVEWRDPNADNLVAQVSIAAPQEHGRGPRVAIIDCGCKRNIARSLLARGLSIAIVPWNHPIQPDEYDGVLISNGPGDPQQCRATIENVRRLLASDIPVFGICLGHQILALAAGGETYKLKYGHRGQNHPCIEVDSRRCFITSQNHGFAVREESLPAEWQPWFANVNDGTNEGLRHGQQPFQSVQFHPEAAPGPTDTAFLFDAFAEQVLRRAA